MNPKVKKQLDGARYLRDGGVSMKELINILE
jgi:hypothetical protein